MRPFILPVALWGLLGCFIGPMEPSAPCTGVVVADGNSLTDSTFNQPSWFSIVRDSSHYPGVRWYNVARSGWATTQLTDSARLRVDTLAPADSEPVRIVVFWEITNDIALWGADTNSAPYHLRAYTEARQKLWQVLVVSVLPREVPGSNPYNGFLTPEQFEHERQVVNAWMRTNRRTIADGLVDVAADTAIGRTGANLVGPYYRPDRVHLSNAGQERIAGLVRPVIDAAIIAACRSPMRRR